MPPRRRLTQNAKRWPTAPTGRGCSSVRSAARTRAKALASVDGRTSSLDGPPNDGTAFVDDDEGHGVRGRACCRHLGPESVYRVERLRRSSVLAHERRLVADITAPRLNNPAGHDEPRTAPVGWLDCPSPQLRAGSMLGRLPGMRRRRSATCTEPRKLFAVDVFQERGVANTTLSAGRHSAVSTEVRCLGLPRPDAGATSRRHQANTPVYPLR